MAAKTLTEEQRSVWLFFAIAYAFSWAFWVPAALAARGAAFPTRWVNFLNSPWNPAAFGPLVSAFLLTLVRDGGRGALRLLRRAIDVRFRKVWLLAILVMPVALFGGAILLSTAFGGRALDISVLSNPPYAAIGFLVILFTAGPLQEEFGWRGYALPCLQGRFTALASSAILGFFWWLWHLPAVFIPGKFMTDDPLVFLGLLGVILLTSILFTWMYNNTGGSLLAALLMHTAMNWAIWLARPSMQMDWPAIVWLIVFLAVVDLAIIRVWGAGRLMRPQE